MHYSLFIRRYITRNKNTFYKIRFFWVLQTDNNESIEKQSSPNRKVPDTGKMVRTQSIFIFRFFVVQCILMETILWPCRRDLNWSYRKETLWVICSFSRIYKWRLWRISSSLFVLLQVLQEALAELQRFKNRWQKAVREDGCWGDPNKRPA